MKTLNHIQFLRAVSVLLVFLYHLQIDIFKNGYLGVDIFFVISGYVITSRIYLEYIKDNSFSFLNFYLKRLKRIFPALIFILSITLVIILIFQPVDLIVGNIIVYTFTIFGFSNIYYLYSNKDYFDNIFEDIFAHTWSLGVEEQFYIVFPIFFVFLIKHIKNFSLKVLILFFVISIGVFFTAIFSDNTKLIFYSPLFRFWEFLVGSLTFIISTKYVKKSLLIFLISFFLLIFVSFKLSLFKHYQLVALSVFLSSMLIFFYESNKFSKILFENNFLVSIGNISYSFYLWHLPVIYFSELYFSNTLLIIPILLFITLVLSYFTYHFIEQKFRYMDFKIELGVKKIFAIVVTTIFSIFFVNYIALQKSDEGNLKKKLKDLVYNFNYLERKINYSNRTVFYKINIDGKEVYQYCVDSAVQFNLIKNSLKKECFKKGLLDKRLFFVSGNSHTVMFLPMLTEAIDRKDNLYMEIKSNSLEMADFNMINSLLKNYDEVIFVTYLGTKQLEKIKFIKNLDKRIKILFIGPIPNAPKKINPLKCYIQNINCDFKSTTDFKNRNLKKFFEDFENLNFENRNINFFNPYHFLCPEKKCSAYNKEIDLLLLRDNSHLTIEGSLLLKNSFKDFYKNSFKKY